MNTQDQIQIIKTKMPETYKAIQIKAGQVGNEAYALVKRGLRGEANCFWAMEAGHVVGTPFNMPDLNREMAAAMVQFGCLYVCTFGPVPKGAAHGSH